MKAIIHWDGEDREPPTYCEAKIVLPKPLRGGTDYKLRFDRKWWRVCYDKSGMYVQIGGAAAARSKVEMVL